MAQTTTIRVSTTTRDRLKTIAESRGKTTGDLLAEIAGQLDENALLEAAAESWDAMGEDALARYRAESRDLEAFTAELSSE